MVLGVFFSVLLLNQADEGLLSLIAILVILASMGFWGILLILPDRQLMRALEPLLWDELTKRRNQLECMHLAMTDLVEILQNTVYRWRFKMVDGLPPEANDRLAFKEWLGKRGVVTTGRIEEILQELGNWRPDHEAPDRFISLLTELMQECVRRYQNEKSFKHSATGYKKLLEDMCSAFDRQDLLEKYTDILTILEIKSGSENMYASSDNAVMTLDVLAAIISDEVRVSVYAINCRRETTQGLTPGTGLLIKFELIEDTRFVFGWTVPIRIKELHVNGFHLLPYPNVETRPSQILYSMDIRDYGLFLRISHGSREASAQPTTDMAALIRSLLPDGSSARSRVLSGLEEAARRGQAQPNIASYAASLLTEAVQSLQSEQEQKAADVPEVEAVVPPPAATQVSAQSSTSSQPEALDELVNLLMERLHSKARLNAAGASQS